jgi:hypothetical protein
MRFHSILSVFFLFFILIAPLSIKAQVSSPPAIPQAVTMEEAHQLIEEYKALFMKLALDGFMALFSKEAIENRMIPYADIREAYERTIAHTQSITYGLKIYSLQTYAQSAFVTGRYQIIQSFKKGDKKNIFHGDIQWALIRENGSLKIREVNYGRDR